MSYQFGGARELGAGDGKSLEASTAAARARVRFWHRTLAVVAPSGPVGLVLFIAAVVLFARSEATSGAERLEPS
jgi:hypothetical protein